MHFNKEPLKVNFQVVLKYFITIDCLCQGQSKKITLIYLKIMHDLPVYYFY